MRKVVVLLIRSPVLDATATKRPSRVLCEGARPDGAGMLAPWPNHDGCGRFAAPEEGRTASG
jgi:hypothetical protein